MFFSLTSPTIQAPSPLVHRSQCRTFRPREGPHTQPLRLHTAQLSSVLALLFQPNQVQLCVVSMCQEHTLGARSMCFKSAGRRTSPAVFFLFLTRLALLLSCAPWIALCDVCVLVPLAPAHEGLRKIPHRFVPPVFNTCSNIKPSSTVFESYAETITIFFLSCV
jgi:hypothetical protein